MKKIGKFICGALGFVGAGVMMAAGARFEGCLHDIIGIFISQFQQLKNEYIYEEEKDI